MLSGTETSLAVLSKKRRERERERGERKRRDNSRERDFGKIIIVAFRE